MKQQYELLRVSIFFFFPICPRFSVIILFLNHRQEKKNYPYIKRICVTNYNSSQKILIGKRIIFLFSFFVITYIEMHIVEGVRNCCLWQRTSYSKDRIRCNSFIHRVCISSSNENQRVQFQHFAHPPLIVLAFAWYKCKVSPVLHLCVCVYNNSIMVAMTKN